MSFPLAELMTGSEVDITPGLPPVTGVNADSRAIAAGNAFFAVPGTQVHGEEFAGEAKARGAVVMITDRAPTRDPGLPFLVVKDVRAAYARAAAHQFAPQPDVAVAVTGTNGKTSVASFVRQIWQGTGIKAASLGTLGIETADGLEPGALTTPDALSLHRALGALKQAGIDHVVIEASSQGLDQRRVDGLKFQAVGFTNLTEDHLEYHHGLENYREAKLRLFRDLLVEGGAAVVNADDPEHEPFMYAALDRGAQLMTVGREGSFFEVGEIINEGFGQHVKGRLVGEPVEFTLPLTGKFQVSNALVALGLAMATGVEQGDAITALATLTGARGRLELAGRRQGGAVFVDYAHTPDALENALAALRPYAKGTLSVVFGCGGDRDKAKRPRMGAIATRLADRVIVTDDNPRSEDPAAIRAEILAGAPGAEVIEDRGRAIEMAMAGMGAGDIVLIAGKGHEDYQILGSVKRHFSDHEAVSRAMESRG